eukprot:7737512-Pyramimonas_sp.AAC.1
MRHLFPDLKLYFDREYGWISEAWTPLIRATPHPGRQPTAFEFINDVGMAVRHWDRTTFKIGIDAIA